MADLACGGPSHFSAYLVDQIGPTATPVNLIAVNHFTLNNGCMAGIACPGETATTVFSGLDLGPGSYWIVLVDPNTGEDPSNFTGGGQWYSAEPSQVMVASGVVYSGFRYATGFNGAFPPATAFSLWPLPHSDDVIFSVASVQDPAAIPEPSLLAPVAMAIVAMGVLKTFLRSKHGRAR